MGRKVDVGHLVGARTASERLTLPRVQGLHNFRRIDPEFPDALYWTTRGRGGTGVWYWPDIWRWAKASRLPTFVTRPPPPLRRLSPLPVRRIDVDDLIDGKAMGACMGLRGPRSYHLIVSENLDFPAPVFSSNGGRWGTQLWVWPDIRRWARRSRRSVAVGLDRPLAELRELPDR